MTPRSLSHRAPLLGLALGWCLGSTLAHLGLVSWPAALYASLALAGLALAWLGGSRRLPWALGLCLALAAAGALRTDERRARPAEWDALGLPPREAELRLRIDRLFASSPGEERAGGLAHVVRAAPHLDELTGQRIQFFVTWPADPSIGVALPGREFTALGVLDPVPFRPGPEDPEFDRYLAAEGVNFTFNRARLLDSPTPAGVWSRFCAAAGARLENILRRGLGAESNEPLADLYVAMLLGRKGELSDAQRERFIETGTMHLFAISGLHIAGIALALNTVLTLLRLPRLARFFIGTLTLALYVEITGGAPSAVRAFWMVTCLLGAQQLRAPSNSLAALAASALCVLVIDPHQLFSAGFQMSYGIVAALLLYGVPLQERWLAAWQPWANLPKSAWTARHHGAEWVGRGILSAIALGLAATLVSTPATVAFFGLVAPGGFFVNLVLIPVAALVLFAGVAAMLVGLLGLAPLAVLFNHAAALVLAAMDTLVVRTLDVPGVSWPAAYASPWMAGAASAGMLALLALGYARGWRPREGGYWAPYAVLGLVLVLGVRGASVTAP